MHLEPLGFEFSRSAEFYEEIENALHTRGAFNAKDMIGSLRRWRSNADYDLDQTATKNKAEFAITTAKQALQKMEEEIV